MANRTNTRRVHKLRDKFYKDSRLLHAAGDREANWWLRLREID